MINSIRFNYLTVFFLICIAIVLSPLPSISNGVIIPTDSSQKDFLNTYKLALYKSYNDYRFTSNTIDTVLFPKYGEESVYWVRTGSNKGSLVVPDAVPSSFSGVSATPYNVYDWQSCEHYSIQYKPSAQRVAIFRSDIKRNNYTVSWEAIYFKNIFDSYLYGDIYYYINEKELDSAISGSTQLLIIPSFSLDGSDNKKFIDSIFSKYKNIKTKIGAFLAAGGTIYTEGNSVYFIEKLGYLPDGAVDFNNTVDADPLTNLVKINFANSSNPIAFTQSAAGNSLYCSSIPMVNTAGAEIIASTDEKNHPAAFVLKGAQAGGGRIVSNLGLPAKGGYTELKKGSRQLQWTLNAILYAFSRNIDVTRSIYNELPDTLTAGKNAVAYDAIDTFEVRILLRNLSDKQIDGIELRESLRSANIQGAYKTYFSYIDVVTPGVDAKFSGTTLTLSNISLPANSEMIITYRLATPDPNGNDAIHENVDKFIAWRTYIYATVNTTIYGDGEGANVFWKYRNYADIMFSARLVADTDLNWKNFLGLYYQPFKVFMIMENKERTPAMQTKYVQYIPKDVPFYWSDNSINIPILKTPGGKFVDVLRGSNDENNPEYDMDSDGHPDVWLDTNSIYPKGFTITEEEVYWLNPWEHLRTGNSFLYEDIDHDGKRAEDTDGDGIVDIEEPGDKIRVWKVTWDIGTVAGYEYFDPYCSYEIWVDPPDLVALSAGVGKAYNKLDEDVGGMFYPYTQNIPDANLADTTWSHWMERDKEGSVIWKQLIYQSIHNYEGFTFIDTAKENYTLLKTDRCAGTVPQPHREFIAVLSMGGEEIDMLHPTPQQSLYSKVEYNTIFNEHRTTPIRTTYTYYAPLPNPLQFEYLSNNFQITDLKGNKLQYLPEWGKANLTFDMDASTEYSYYWIRNAGHDVDYNDPSEAAEGVEKLGDGVFGYMIYDLPKGMGGYKITLPKKPDGSFDMDAIVEVDGKPFQKWLDNPNTKNAVEVWEDPFQYHIYIPQLLIPPALDDDNFDGIDDWLDDRGDRFCSSSGFLHDGFMLDNGEKWRDYPEKPFKDDIYGMVDSGWYHGADGTYGDDFFENLGKTHFKIHAVYEGLGREGPIDISKGGWLVVEEIFGGSPWVIFSHVLSGYAKGVDYKIISTPTPSLVKYGLDTGYIKHVVEDVNEPHDFDVNFDPYHVSFGYGETTITTSAGGMDPCNLIEPAITMSTLVDPSFAHKNLRLVPNADPKNPDLTGYPKDVSGTFLEIKIEVMNGTDDNWLNTKITTQIPKELGNTKVAMSYVAYPRPLVPSKVDPSTGEIIQGGDDIGAFRAGWRFNQPEGEVLVKMGETLPLLQPSRRAYFIILLSIDESLKNGIYNVDFNISGQRKHYDGVIKGNISYEIPSAYFSIIKRNSAGNVTNFEKIIIGTGKPENIKVQTTDYFKGLQNVKWSLKDINNSDFDNLPDALPAVYDDATGVETINLSSLGEFPTVKNPRFYMLEKGEIYSYGADDDFYVSTEEKLNYTYDPFGGFSAKDDEVMVSTVGPKLLENKRINTINGKKIKDKEMLQFASGQPKDIEVLVSTTNVGNDIAENSTLEIYPGPYYIPIISQLPSGCTFNGKYIQATLGACVPGETKDLYLHFTENDKACSCMYDTSMLVPYINVSYVGNAGKGSAGLVLFSYPDKSILDAPAKDFRISSLTASGNEVKRGSSVTITANYQNGLIEENNVLLNIYSVVDNRDTALIGQKLLSRISKYEKSNFSVNYSIPDSINCLELFAKIDADETFTEFCENNNVKSLVLPIEGPNWILDVYSYPNPADYKAYITYILPREMNKISLIIYSLDGVLINKIDDCPQTIGRHTLLWFTANLPKGTYIYKFLGINTDGKLEEFSDKLIRD